MKNRTVVTKMLKENVRNDYLNLNTSEKKKRNNQFSKSGLMLKNYLT